MTYDELITDICSQVGDPDKDTYESRAKDLLQSAISSLVAQKQYTLSELPGFVKKKSNLALSTTAVDISAYNIIEIINIVPKYDVTYATNPWYIKLIQLNDNNLGGIYSNIEQRPTKEDVLVVRYGDYLQAIINVTASNFSAPTDVYMFYLEDPDILSSYTGGDSVLDDFRMSFIQRAKLLAIQMLKAEDEINN